MTPSTISNLGAEAVNSLGAIEGKLLPQNHFIFSCGHQG